MYAGQRCSSWCLKLPPAIDCSMPTARISSVIAIAKTPSLNASTRPVSMQLGEQGHEPAAREQRVELEVRWARLEPLGRSEHAREDVDVADGVQEHSGPAEHPVNREVDVVLLSKRLVPRRRRLRTAVPGREA